MQSSLAALIPLAEQNACPRCSGNNEREDVEKEECRSVQDFSLLSMYLAPQCNIIAPESQAKVETAVGSDTLKEDPPLDRDTAGAMKPAAAQAVESLSSEFAVSFVCSFCISVICASSNRPRLVATGSSHPGKA
jgi:hypothetical protein